MTEAESAFLRFVDPYRAYGEKIQVKVDHTLRVKDLCADIARSIDLDTADVELATACGLLHDVGRFEQWRVYGTYNDSKSADHGDLGSEFLEGHDLIRAYSEADRITILNAVRYHNKFQLPDVLNARDRLFANITRDADKLDILYSYGEGILTSRSKDTAMSEAVFKAVLDKRCVRNQELVTKADGIAVHLALVFDLRFERSFEVLREHGSVDKAIRRHIEETGNDSLKAQLEALREHIDRYLETSSN